MKNQKCYRILETLKYCFSSEKSKIRIEPNKAAGGQEEETYSRGGWFVNQGGQSDATAGEGQVTDRSHLFVLFL